MIKGHQNLNNLVYPVASLGAAGWLSHLKVKSERLEILNTFVCEMEVDEYGTNAAESLTMCFMDRCFLEFRRWGRTC